MPEMPEVETVVRSLRPHLVGRRIRQAKVLDPKLAAFDAKRVESRKITGVSRSGKEIVIDVSTKKEPLWVCVHLRMTGKLLWATNQLPLNEKHLRAHFSLNGGNLFFFDSRRFGILRLCDEPQQWVAPGMEILSEQFTVTWLKSALAGSVTAIKPWLLRQDRIVGFGNIYASEVLFAAGIDPRKPAKKLTDKEIGLLHRATKRIFAKAIECGGTTVSDFMDCEGECGGYQRFLKIYGCEGEACPRCGGEVLRQVQQGRSSFFCEHCQK